MQITACFVPAFSVCKKLNTHARDDKIQTNGSHKHGGKSLGNFRKSHNISDNHIRKLDFICPLEAKWRNECFSETEIHQKFTR